MAVRRGARGALGGLGEGLSAVGTSMLRTQAADEASHRTFVRQILKDYEDKVIKGDLEPEQAAAALSAYGVNVPVEHFRTVAPSIEGKLRGMIEPLGRANNPGEIPSTPEVLAMAPPAAKRVAQGSRFSPSEPDVTTGVPSLESNQMQPTSLPSFQKILDAYEGARNRFMPTRVEGVNAEGLKTEQFVSSNPAQLTGRTFPKEPTPEQGATLTRRGIEATGREGIPALKGTQAGQEETAKAKAGQFSPEYAAAEVGAKNVVEAGTRRERVRTAASTAAATTQAGIDVSTAPGNVTKEAARAAALRTAVDKAAQDLKEAGVPPELADSFMHVSDTGKAYVFIDPSVPAEIRSMTYKRAGATVPGIRFVNKDQNDAMQQIGSARKNLAVLLKAYSDHLPRDAGGRIISAPANRLALYLQTDPTMKAAYEASYGPMIEIFRASTAGVRGFRMTAAELNRAQSSIPLPTDTWETAVRKVAFLGDVFEGLEDQIIGRPGK